jgi:hypothetical protein
MLENFKEKQMVDFRKSFLLATMALAIGAGTASAQNCAATTGAPPTLRQEGVEELTGAFQLQCTNIPATTTVNFDVTLNQATLPITSRVGEPMVTVQQGTASGTAIGSVVNTNTGSVGANDVRFTGISVPAGNSTITFTGIRTNANVVVTTGGFGQVFAFTSVSNGVLNVTEPTQGLAVATVLPGLGPVTATGPTVSACAGVLNLQAGVNFTVNIPELFPTAFKQQNAGPGQDSETGPFAAGMPPFAAVPATSGTQFAVVFNGIPSGITFYVPVTIGSINSLTGAPAGGVANVVVSEGSTVLNAGGAIPNGPSGSYVAVTSGTTIYYNVTTSMPSITETYQIPVYNTAGTLSTGIGTTVTVNLAPLGTDFPITPNVPVPSTALVPLFVGGKPAVSFTSGQTGCQTSLLFPFLSNQAGFDTGISIAATGTDPFNTNIGGGTCTLYLYGAPGAPPATPPTLAVPAGGEFHTTVSAIAPNFQGYGIAVCPFTYAHGYAFISDGFMGAGRGLSEGYVAKVIDYRNGASTLIQQVPINAASSGTLTYTTPKPESLGN